MALRCPGESIERRDFTDDGEGWIYQFTVPARAVGPKGAVVTVLSGTWNPAAAGVGERNEDLGVYVHNVEVWREGRPFEVRDAQGIAPLPGTPHLIFWWANDDATRHHLTDSWAWYAKVAGLGQPLTGRWIGGYGTAAAVILATGLVLGWRSLPAGLFHMTTRRKRRRTKSKAPRVIEPHEQAA